MKEPARKTPKKRVRDDGWRLPDALWARMGPLLPPRPKHPLGCHDPRGSDRAAMDAVFFVPRTGCQWNAPRETRLCSSSSAHRRFQGWVAAGVFEAFWREGLLAYDALAGIDWAWLALDGAVGKAPLGGGRNRPQPDRPGQARGQALLAHRRPRRPARGGDRRANRNDHKLMRRTVEAIPVRRPEPARRRPQHLRLDKGFDHAEPRALAVEFAFALHLRTRGEEARAKRRVGAKARRWVVERTRSWLNRFRAIPVRWNKKPANHLAMLHLALGTITWRHALPG